MATIRGTQVSDWLTGTIESDVISGRAGNDYIEDVYGGNNTIYGNKGNDHIISVYSQGYDQLFGGVGDDTVITYGGDAYGQAGNDQVYASKMGVGGLGNDHVFAVYETDPIIKTDYVQLFGDNLGNGRKGGDDTLTAFTANKDYVRMSGGGGSDTFEVESRLDGYGTLTEVMDFKDGVDKLSIDNRLYYGDGEGPSNAAVVFDNLDRYDDNVLNQNDAMFGAPLSSDPNSNSITFAVGDDWVKVNGVSQIDTSDWLLFA